MVEDDTSVASMDGDLAQSCGLQWSKYEHGLG